MKAINMHIPIPISDRLIEALSLVDRDLRHAVRMHDRYGQQVFAEAIRADASAGQVAALERRLEQREVEHGA